MTRKLASQNLCLVAVGVTFIIAMAIPPKTTCAFQQPAPKQTWTAPSVEQLQKTFAEWQSLANDPANATKVKAQQLLETEERMANEPLDVAADVIGLLFPDFEATIAELEQTGISGDANAILARSSESIERLPDSVRATARLVVGRGLVRLALYDEAIDIMNALTVDDVVDPASLHFYRALALHRLVRKDECLVSLGQLLQNEYLLPRRFAAMGRLMLADIQEVKPDSLDEIARLMQDASRHQSLSRSGSHVIEIEESVLAKLDKLIEEAEKQQQQQQQQSTSQAAPSKPMDRSRTMPGRGDGEVTDRQNGEGGAWGNLPPRERAAALMEMTRDLPPHYREVIEEYFRQLAKEK